MTGRSKPVVLLLCCLVQFMVGARRRHRERRPADHPAPLHIGQDSLQWVVTAYGLMLGGFLLLGGRLGDLLGRPRILLTGLVVFTGASVVAGLAGSAAILIPARAVRDLGASLIPPAALAIPALTFTDWGPSRLKVRALPRQPC